MWRDGLGIKKNSVRERWPFYRQEEPESGRVYLKGK